MSSRIIGIDPGSSICGVVVLDDNRIIYAANVKKDDLLVKITHFLLHRSCIVVIEDLKPYSLRLTPQVIDTAKFIGEAVYRLKIGCSANVALISRFEVKKWVFDAFQSVTIPLINKKVGKKVYLACNIDTKEEILIGKRKASFVYVDDKIVTEAMKHYYNIPMPPPGSGYLYGLKDHSWQALALATYFKTNSALISSKS